MFKAFAAFMVLGGFMFHVIATDGFSNSSCVKLEKELVRVAKTEGSYRAWRVEANIKGMRLGSGAFTKSEASKVNDRLSADVSCTLGLLDIVIAKVARASTKG